MDGEKQSHFAVREPTVPCWNFFPSMFYQDQVRKGEGKVGQRRESKKTEEEEKGEEHDEEKIIQKSEPVQGKQEPKNDKSLLSRERADDEVIRHFEETEGTRKIIADSAEGSNSDMEQWIHTCTELTGLDDEQKKT